MIERRPVIRDIRTSWESTPALWSAIDANTYDGAPDGGGVIGYGKTESEAIRDLEDVGAMNGAGEGPEAADAGRAEALERLCGVIDWLESGQLLGPLRGLRLEDFKVLRDAVRKSA